MTGRLIQRLRHTLGESTADFGLRFYVSGRTVESWEQDRSRPGGMTLHALFKLAEKHHLTSDTNLS